MKVLIYSGHFFRPGHKSEPFQTTSLNELFQTLYDIAEEDIEPSVLEQLLDLVWETWIGEDVLPDLETDDIYDWCQHVLNNREQHLKD